VATGSQQFINVVDIGSINLASFSFEPLLEVKYPPTIFCDEQDGWARVCIFPTGTIIVHKPYSNTQFNFRQPIIETQ
jgi:hypothetical protein